eukprot:scaffold3877_cov116-Isochrysis_galbana.AAC.2
MRAATRPLRTPSSTTVRVSSKMRLRCRRSRSRSRPRLRACCAAADHGGSCTRMDRGAVPKFRWAAFGTGAISSSFRPVEGPEELNFARVGGGRPDLAEGRGGGDGTVSIHFGTSQWELILADWGDRKRHMQRRVQDAAEEGERREGRRGKEGTRGREKEPTPRVPSKVENMLAQYPITKLPSSHIHYQPLSW